MEAALKMDREPIHGRPVYVSRWSGHGSIDAA